MAERVVVRVSFPSVRYTRHQVGGAGLQLFPERPAPLLLSDSWHFGHAAYFTATTVNVGTSCVFRVRSFVTFFENREQDAFIPTAKVTEEGIRDARFERVRIGGYNQRSPANG